MSTVMADEKKIPTMTPARRSVWIDSALPAEAIANTAPAASNAPAKANAARPSAARIVGPRPKIWPVTTPKAAPPETPSTAGSASGLRVRA